MNRQHLGVSLGCVSAAIAGYLIARQPFTTVGNDPGITPDRNHSPEVRNGDRESGASALAFKTGREPRSEKQLKALKNGLRERFSNCASASRDWNLRTESAAMLATMSISELEAFAAEILPARRIGFPPDDWRLVLAKQIYQAWGLKDPASACLSRTGGWGLGLNVFNDWLRRDPEAAAAFCEQTRLSREMDPLAKSMHQSQLNQQALTDLQGASKSLNDLDPNTRAATMVGWARMFANDPAKRQELANLLASWTDPKLGTNCLKSLISEFSKRSPSEAAAFVETLAVSESVKDQLSHEVIGEWASKEAKQAFNAWMERGESEVPKPLLHAMDKWSTNGQGANESFEWVNGLERGPVKEQLKSHMVTNLTLYGHLPQAATLSAGLEDSIERIRRMRWVKEIWDQRDPKQANEWFAKLPPEDRDMIEGK